jgi:hypothetical protein
MLRLSRLSPLPRWLSCFCLLLVAGTLRRSAAEEPEGDDANKLDDYYYSPYYDKDGEYDGQGGNGGSGYSSSSYQSSSSSSGEKITYWTDYAIFPKRCIV